MANRNTEAPRFQAMPPQFGVVRQSNERYYFNQGGPGLTSIKASSSSEVAYEFHLPSSDLARIPAFDTPNLEEISRNLAVRDGLDHRIVLSVDGFGQGGFQTRSRDFQESIGLSKGMHFRGGLFVLHVNAGTGRTDLEVIASLGISGGGLHQKDDLRTTVVPNVVLDSSEGTLSIKEAGKNGRFLYHFSSGADGLVIFNQDPEQALQPVAKEWEARLAEVKKQGGQSGELTSEDVQRFVYSKKQEAHGLEANKANEAYAELRSTSSSHAKELALQRGLQIKTQEAVESAAIDIQMLFDIPEGKEQRWKLSPLPIGVASRLYDGDDVVTHLQQGKVQFDERTFAGEVSRAAAQSVYEFLRRDNDPKSIPQNLQEVRDRGVATEGILDRYDSSRRESFYPETRGKTTAFAVPTKFSNVWLVYQFDNSTNRLMSAPHILVAESPMPPRRWN